MLTDVPNVDENRVSDADIQLWLGYPATPARQSYDRALYDAFGITLSYTDGEDHNSLRFSIYKDSSDGKDVQDLTGDVEIIVRWWDPRRNELREPPGSRFVILNSQEDAMDNTNVITYECAAISWLLEQVKVRTSGYVNYASRLNRDYDRAKERYEEAEREYDSLLQQFESAGRAIQRAHWPNSTHGPLFATRGRSWLIRDRRAKFRSIVSDHYLGGRLFWYSSDVGGWRALSMTSGTSSVRARKEEMFRLGPQVYAARKKMNSRRAAYASAERAARETSRDGTRFFYNRTPGRVLTTLWMEGWERDTGFVGHNDGEGTWNSPYDHGSRFLKGMYRHFTATNDCKGRAWTRSTTRGNWEVSLGQSYWQTIQDFRERGEIDVRMGGVAVGGGGRDLQLAPKGGFEVDQTRRVSFRLGNGVTEAPETIDRSAHHSITLVLDSTGLNRYTSMNRGLSSSQTPWGLWEGSISEPGAGNLAESISMTAEARREASRRYRVDASRRTFILPGQPIPMLDYEPHHVVTVHDHEGAASERKITQIIVEKSDPNEPITATIRFGTRITNKRVSYAKTLSKTLGGSEHIQGHIPAMPRAGVTDIPSDALYAPPLESISTRVVFNEAGRAQVALSAQLAAHDIPEPDDAVGFDSSPEGSELVSDEEYEGE